MRSQRPGQLIALSVGCVAPPLQVEGFLAWLIPRAASVQHLTITERRGDQLSDPVRCAPFAMLFWAAPHWLPFRRCLAATRGSRVPCCLPIPLSLALSLAQVLWGNCVSAITILGPQLRQLTLEWPVQLTLSQWMGALQQLQLASFASDHVVSWLSLPGVPVLGNWS